MVAMTGLRGWVRRTVLFSLALLLSGVFSLSRLSTNKVAAAGPLRLPPGFELKVMPSGMAKNFDLTDFAFTPDGGYFTVGKSGQVVWVSASGQAHSLNNLLPYTEGDLGLVGLAVAPDYANSKQIYLARSLYQTGQLVMRLSAWNVVTNPEPSNVNNERIIFEIPLTRRADGAGTYNVHGLTNITASADGSLWVSVGDNSNHLGVDPNALRAQNLDEPYGKLFHIWPDGRAVESNPFYNPGSPASWRSRVYAYGFRSPFRVSLDPKSGAPILGDVGWATYEEVDLLRPGTNYGWPCWEANFKTDYQNLPSCAGVNNTQPLAWYQHGPAGTSITGGMVYTGSSYPAAYRGAYFFGDYSSQRLYSLTYNDQGQLTRPFEPDGFGADIGGPVRFNTATNGDIVFADIYNNQIKRLVYTQGNRPPIANAHVTTNATTRTVSFDASGSSDLDGDSLTYKWDFGDGASGSGVKVNHTYAAPGTNPFTAKLTVTDSQGAQATASYKVVPANSTPTLKLVTPPADTRYKVGDNIKLSATATDKEDGKLSVSWQTTQVHCSGGYCHNHPGPSSTGNSYSHIFEDHEDDTRLEITARATDKYGMSVEQRFVALPKLQSLTITSNTPSVITINGSAHPSANVIVGSSVKLSAPLTATDGVASFDHWSSGAAREHNFAMPDQPVNLAATYLTPITRRYQAEPYLQAVLGAPVAPEAGDANLRYQDFPDGRMYWSKLAGVHEVHGAIKNVYLSQGGHQRFGEPTTDELPTPGFTGRYNHFAGGWGTGPVSIYWTPATGAQAVYGAIREQWERTGWELGPHGFPRSTELSTPNGRGRYTDFQNGGIYWLPGSDGAKSVYGAIYQKWAEYGWESGLMGFPVTSEWPTPDLVGRFNHFEGGSIYWHPNTGAHAIYGAIRERWAILGWERSYLGYPTSDEFGIPGGRQTNFEHGYISWDARTGAVIDRPY